MADLTGNFIHWQLNGELGHWAQGHVIGNASKPNQEPLWIVQTFSWLTGGPKHKIFLTNAELLDGFVRIYEDIADWRRAGDRLPSEDD